MLDFFAIFSKSGIVLFTTVNPALNTVVTRLIKHVLLEERAVINGKYQSDQLQLQYAMDNEFEMIFVVGYQKLLNLKYVDKFLTDIQRAFRDRYPNFDLNLYHSNNAVTAVTRWMKVKSGFDVFNEKPRHEPYKLDFCDLVVDLNYCMLSHFANNFAQVYKPFVLSGVSNNKVETMRTFQDSAKSKKTISSMVVPKAEVKPTKVETKTKLKKSKDDDKKKKVKAARAWELGGSNPEEFDFSKKTSSNETRTVASSINKNILPDATEVNLQMSEDESSDDDEKQVLQKKSYFTAFRDYISLSKKLTSDDLKPVLNQLSEHLTRKNVAADIAEKLCESVCAKLEGQSIDSWLSLSKIAQKALESVVLQILNPNRNINILREVQAKPNPPYVIVFCGVNGVGKSTNLAKIANWLIVNNIKILVIAGDTFRAGAVEQLKTHVQALKSIHERGKDASVKIELFERGYGKDAAGIAMDGIKYARMNGFGCVLVDTAGRMQDNEPLMRQLAKLITVNKPDLTLFVGEALVGNEAVDQLSKFNQSLIDAGCLHGPDKSAINGIVLTKFDTIDDQVGAAISMTYVTGQPIVFVGVGQTYKDLKQLDAKAVTKALMR